MSRSADRDFRAKADAHLARDGGGFDIFRIAPPLTVDAAEIDLGLEVFDRALTKALH